MAWVALWWCRWPRPAGDVCGAGLIPVIRDVKTYCIVLYCIVATRR